MIIPGGDCTCELVIESMLPLKRSIPVSISINSVAVKIELIITYITGDI